jgi:transcription elongation factor Elf1
MGRRRKKYKRPVRRVHRIPTFFQCPNCGAKTLRIQFKKDPSLGPGKKLAIITCGTCGLYAEMVVPDLYQPVDAYGRFIDLYEEGKIKVEFRNYGEEEEGEESGG